MRVLLHLLLLVLLLLMGKYSARAGEQSERERDHTSEKINHRPAGGL